MTTDNTTPRIYVADLSAYNSGVLHGAWIDATQDADDIAEAVQAMLAAPVSERVDGPREEWAIHDYEGFHGIKLSEWEPFENVATIARLLVEHGPAFAAWVDYRGDLTDLDDDEWGEAFEESYAGEWDSVEDYAQELADEMGWTKAMEDAGIDPSYFDVYQFATDLFIGDYWAERAPGGGVYVFRTV